MKVVGDEAAVEKTAVETGGAPVKEEAKKGVFDDVESPSEMPTEGGEAEGTLAAAKLPGVLTNNAEDRVKINTETYSKADLEITPEDKSAFIDAMITGDRYRRTYSIFGGRVKVTLRSRTAGETHAMYAYIRHMLSTSGEDGVSIVEGDMAYVPLVAQIEELNGTKFPEMKEPLMYTESEGKEVPPGWYEDFKVWKAKPEGLTSSLVSCIQLFEYKYWTMVKEATNKNFWNSDTSTEE